MGYRRIGRAILEEGEGRGRRSDASEQHPQPGVPPPFPNTEPHPFPANPAPGLARSLRRRQRMRFPLAGFAVLAAVVLPAAVNGVATIHSITPTTGSLAGDGAFKIRSHPNPRRCFFADERNPIHLGQLWLGSPIADSFQTNPAPSPPPPPHTRAPTPPPSSPSPPYCHPNVSGCSPRTGSPKTRLRHLSTSRSAHRRHAGHHQWLWLPTGRCRRQVRTLWLRYTYTDTGTLDTYLPREASKHAVSASGG